MVDVKFCGLTRPEDVGMAVDLGADYLGAIFAGGPRHLEPARARALFRNAARGPQRVGVFGQLSPETLAQQARDAGVDIVQLHADPDVDAIQAIRDRFRGPVWAVIRLAGDTLPASARALFAEADGVVLDARSEKGLGGTGVTLPWEQLAGAVAAVRSNARLIVAGGLTPDNISAAIDALRPDVVDVSSGVESSPGVKDHSLMSAFIKAARAGTTTA